MLGATERGELRLKGSYFRSQNELTMIHYTGDRRIDGRPKPPALCGDVNERDEWGDNSAQIHRCIRTNTPVSQRQRVDLSV